LVYTTTRLARQSTHLLPFNNGDGCGAGGPENPNGYKSAYLWEQVWQRDSLLDILLDILTRFIHLKAINRTMVVIYGHLHRASRQRNPGFAVKQNLISSSSRCW
jgi:type I restriction enzyme R subunit